MDIEQVYTQKKEKRNFLTDNIEMLKNPVIKKNRNQQNYLHVFQTELLTKEEIDYNIQKINDEL